MERANWSRRAALLGLGALTLAPGPAGAYETLQPLPGEALARLRLRAIKVDVAPLRNNANGPAADWLEADLPGLLQHAFAARLAPRDSGAPMLVARIDLIVLGSSRRFDGFGFRHRLGGFIGPNATDSIEGAAVILGANGRVLATYPLLSSVQAFADWPGPDIERSRRRVATLAQSFAQWLPGQMGL